VGLHSSLSHSEEKPAARELDLRLVLSMDLPGTWHVSWPRISELDDCFDLINLIERVTIRLLAHRSVTLNLHGSITFIDEASVDLNPHFSFANLSCEFFRTIQLWKRPLCLRYSAGSGNQMLQVSPPF